MRSSWEYEFFLALLTNGKVISLSSEETIITYRYSVDKRKHRYFMDFTYETVSSKGKKQKWLCEVKPFYRTQKPDPNNKSGKKKKRTYVMESLEYMKNMNKWSATLKYCKKHNYRFVFLTDDPTKKSKYRLWDWQELKLPIEEL